MKHLVIGLFLSVILIPCSYAVPNKLALDPKSPKLLTEVELPFQYHPVQKGEKFDVVYQSGSALLTPDSDEDYMIIGPLKPCMGVVFVNKINHSILGFHVSWYNDLNSMKIIYDTLLNVTDPSQVEVHVYSFKVDPKQYATYMQFGLEQQSKELRKVGDFIEKNLQIPSENIHLILWKSPYKDFELGAYELAELYILVDKDGKVYSTCPLAENLFKTKNGAKVIEIENREAPRRQLMTVGMDPTFTSADRGTAAYLGKVPFYFWSPQAKIDQKICSHCLKRKANLKKCSKCETTPYCGPECQKADWPIHKKICPHLKGYQ